jgi:membrane protease YdiL (CAAX protease family)
LIGQLANTDDGEGETEQRGAPEGWRDLGLYVAGGFGVFFVGSLLLNLLFDEVTLAASATVYALNVLCLGGAAYVLGVRRPRRTWAEFGLRPFNPAWLWLALMAAGATLPLRLGAALAVQWLSGGSLADMQPRLDLVAPEGPLTVTFAVTLLGAGLLAPLAEELYFRGLLQGWLRTRFGFWPMVVLSAALFALGHFDSLPVMASTFFLGLICAAAVERGRSLWLAVTIHAVNNSLAVALVYAALAVAN